MGQDNILCHAVPTLVHEAKLCERHCITSICGRTKPVQGQLIILRDSVTVQIHRPQVGLGVRVPLLGQRAPLIQGCCIVSTVIRILASLKVGPCGHGETYEREHEDDGANSTHGPLYSR